MPENNESVMAKITDAADDTKSILEETVAYFTDPAIWVSFIIIVVKIIVIFIAGRIVSRVTNKAIEHMIREREQSPLKFDQRRTKTIGKLIGNVIGYATNFILLLLILNQLGFNLAPLLAGAGVLGLAIGFGAQSLVKDVITGFFIIFEDQFGVGDVIQTGNFKGTVEEIGLRVTRIRNWTGEVHIIPNGSIRDVTNFSIYNSVAVIDISVAYEADVDKALDLMRETAKQLYETNENIVKEPEVLGVQNIGNSDVVLRMTAECKPNMQGPVSRVIKAELRKVFEWNEIGIPYPKIVNLTRIEKAE
ncbi:mechanosensitive ion channel family protein [Paenibacillus sp. MBLB4367]|uniref:mechanosensitive ion channel family protein n=1 Tax=Paenibacillus sp. MBLB4367 TaxID=3384767 RepID=UPI00390842DC